MSAGLATGLFSIPEGLAYTSIAGFNPVAGIYAGVVPTLVGSLLSRTVLMVTTLTSAIALTSQSAIASAGLDPARPENLAALTLLVGLIMVVCGLLRLGVVLSFVSHAVMTGFSTGIAVQIITGVLVDATGYDPVGHNKLVQVVDWIVHIGAWEPTTVAVALGTVAVWAVLQFAKPVRTSATLIAVAGVFAGLWLALLVLTLGWLAEYIPMAVIGGLIIVVALARLSAVARVAHPDDRGTGDPGNRRPRGDRMPLDLLGQTTLAAASAAGRWTSEVS